MEKNVCKKCNSSLENNFHFCPYCGEPLTKKAEFVLAEKDRVAQLKLIGGLVDVVQDELTLKLLNKVANNL